MGVMVSTVEADFNGPGKLFKSREMHDPYMTWRSRRAMGIIPQSSVPTFCKFSPLMSSNWSELPPELIATVSTSLTTIADYTRFRAVCSSWRSAATATPHHLPIQSPCLAFPSPSHCNFLLLPTSKIHSLPLLPDSHQFLGSSDGRLVIRSSSSSALSLFNPLTRFRAHLPFLRTFPMSPFFIKKIVLSPPPVSAAIALLGWSTHIALCRRPGDDDGSWTLIQGSSNYHDALFFNGLFHVVDGFRRIFSLDDGDGGGDNVGLKEVARVRISRAPPFIGRGEKCYLVECGRDLLLVVRSFNRVGVEGQRDVAVTKGFEVFRLEMGGDCDGESSSVELKSLGDKTLFLGLNRSIALLCDECPGFRGNCIYFLDDTLNSMGDVAQSVADNGVFDMSDGSIEPLRYCNGDLGLNHARQPAVWITPSLC